MSELKIALIHATPLAMEPVAKAFADLWPEAECRNLLDDSLTIDLQAAGGMTPGMVSRMVGLASYTQSHGAKGVLFTCSAFGDAIDAAKQALRIPVLKPNEAMFEEALDICAALGGVRKIGLLTTFRPASISMAEELQVSIARRCLDVVVHTACATGAMDKLIQGDPSAHDQMIVASAMEMPDCDVYVVGQFSMARTQSLLMESLGRPVLTSPSSAVRSLKSALSAHS